MHFNIELSSGMGCCPVKMSGSGPVPGLRATGQLEPGQKFAGQFWYQNPEKSNPEKSAERGQNFAGLSRPLPIPD